MARRFHRGARLRGIDARTGSISYPLYQSATFAHPAWGQSTGYCYSRYGNPTRLELENTIALLEGGKKAMAFSSGMAAITTLLKLLRAGDHVLVSDDLYGGTYRLFSNIYTQYGLEFDYVDLTDPDVLAASFKPNTRLVFLETPTNPTMKVADVAAVGEAAHAHGAVFAVDNTFLTMYFQKPFELGADVVIYSGTKYLCGHNDVLSGFLILRDNTLLEPLFNATMSEGNQLDPFDSWLMLRSLKTLGVRLRQQERNAKHIAEALKANPHVTDVFYVGDPDHPNYELSKRQTTGFGAMISFKTDTHERALAVLERTKLILFAETWAARKAWSRIRWCRRTGPSRSPCWTSWASTIACYACRWASRTSMTCWPTWSRRWRNGACVQRLPYNNWMRQGVAGAEAEER